MKKNAWIYYSIAAALFWGVWGVIAKLISEDVNPFVNHVLFTIGMLFTFPLVWKKIRKEKPNRKGIIWGIVSGIFAVTGNVAVFQAFSSGGLAAIVIPLTNLYPLVTIGIALLVFKEKLNWINGIGILIAIPTVIMLSGQTLLFDDPSAFFKNVGLNSWLIFSLVALIFWGVFSAAQKVTTNYISAEWAYAAFIVSSVFISLVFIGLGKVNFDFTRKTLLLGSLAGMLNGLGVLSSFAAYKAEGKASQVTTIAGALQPVFTIILAIIFLSESIKYLELIGIVLAIVAALALSYEKKNNRNMNTILSEIQEIPERALSLLDSPIQALPLNVPYLGMGSSYFAPLAFKYMGINILPEIASEYYNYLSSNTKKPLGVILSQSGKSSEALWCTQLFDKYVAISNYPENELSNKANVLEAIEMKAGEEHFSSSKTYINTLLVLFRGFGFDTTQAVNLLIKKMDKYKAKGEKMADEVFNLLQTKKIHGIYITGSGPNIATAMEAALIMSESTKLNFHGLAMAQYDHGPKETAENSIVIQILAKGKSYERALKLSEKIKESGAAVFTVEEPEAEEHFSVLHNIIPFNFMAYYLSQKMGITDSFAVGGKITEVL